MKKSTFINRLESLRELNGRNKDFINIDLYKLILKEELLVAAYEKIKSNKSGTTPCSLYPFQGLPLLNKLGVGRVRAPSSSFVDGENQGPQRDKRDTRLNNLREQLRNESWQPRPAKRVDPLQLGRDTKKGKEKRVKRKHPSFNIYGIEGKGSPFGIQGKSLPEEKVVQTAMLFVLEAIYEPIFSRASFGFRPHRGPHDALKMIDQKYDGITYAIEGDIKGMYDNANHKTLVALLEKRIKDDRFIRLVWKMLRAGYLYRSQPTLIPEKGTPEMKVIKRTGSIVSPILANIYLHGLDQFVLKKYSFVPKRNNKTRSVLSKDSLFFFKKEKEGYPVYKDIDNRMKVIKDRLSKRALSLEDKKRYLKKLRAFKLSSLKKSMYCDPSNRVIYARYADFFLIGVAGSEGLANQIKEEVGNFLLTLSLTLSEEKTRVTDIRKDYASFLGYRIKRDTLFKFPYVRPKGQPPHLKQVQRVSGKLVSIEAPISKIVQRLAANGFCDTKGFPISKKTWLAEEDNQIIQSFNDTIRGIFGYYSGAHKRRHQQRIWYILRFSCAYTLAAKHRCSLKKIFLKHGGLLKVNFGFSGERSIMLYQPSLKEENRKWQTGLQLHIV